MQLQVFWRSSTLVCASVVVACAAATATTFSIHVLHIVPFALNFVVVSAFAWYCGSFAGLLATVLSALLVEFFVLEPAFSFFNKTSFVPVTVFFAVSVFMCLIARQRDKKERALLRSEHLFRGLVEGIAEGFQLLDANWTFIYINRQGAAMSNHIPEQMVGRNLFELFSGIIGTRFETELKRTTREQKQTHWTEFYQPLQKWFEVSAYPTTQGIAVLFQDVTEKVNAEERLRTADRLAIAGRLAATVSHEINNPLEAIGNLLYLASREESIDSIRTFLEEAEIQLLRASHIAKQTLSFHKLQADVAEVHLSEAVDAAVRLFHGRGDSRNVVIITSVEPDLVSHIAPGHLIQVIVNLISNAIDASPKNSQIVVKAFRREESATLTVTDSGPGVPEALRHKIFEPFFTTKTDYGTGLGLWVCRNIVEGAGGSISLDETERPFSTTFTVKLPLVLRQQSGSRNARLDR